MWLLGKKLNYICVLHFISVGQCWSRHKVDKKIFHLVMMLMGSVEKTEAGKEDEWGECFDFR